MFGLDKKLSNKGDRKISTLSIYYIKTKDTLCKFDLIKNDNKIGTGQFIRYRVINKNFSEIVRKDPDFFAIYGFINYYMNNPVQPSENADIQSYNNWVYMLFCELIHMAKLNRKISIKTIRVLKLEKHKEIN